MSTGFKRGSELRQMKYPPAPRLCARWIVRMTGKPIIVIGIIRYKGNYQLRIYKRTECGHQRIRPTIPILTSEAEDIISNLEDLEKCQEWLKDKITANKQLENRLSDWKDVISDIKTFQQTRGRSPR
jgi:hypothetical protein